MKKLLLLLFSTLAVYSAAAQSVDQRFGDLISSGDYFGLAKEYSANADKIGSPMIKLFSESLLAAAFNRPAEACALIDSLIQYHQQEIEFQNVIDMFGMKVRILKFAGKTEEAASEIESFISQIEPFADAELLAQMKGTLSTLTTELAAGMPTLTWERPSWDVRVPISIDEVKWKDDVVGHELNIEARFNGNTRKALLDTGAPDGIFVTEKFAKENGITILIDSITVSGAGRGIGKYGFLEELVIGGIVFRNIPAIVVPAITPDENITPVDAIIGNYVLTALEEMVIYPEQRLIVFPAGASQLPATGRNMITLDGQFFIEAFMDGDPLVLHFDTGNSSSSLDDTFYEKYTRLVKQTGKRDSKFSGGYGAVFEEEIYRLPVLDITIADKDLKIENVPVSMKKNMLFQKSEDGALGTGFVRACDKITVNFREMFITVE